MNKNACRKYLYISVFSFVLAMPLTSPFMFLVFNQFVQNIKTVQSLSASDTKHNKIMIFR
jgi:hypothetical protein